MTYLSKAAQNSYLITKAKEFTIWCDFSEVGRHSIAGKDREVYAIMNRGHHPLQGFEQYNDGFSNYANLSQSCLNNLPYLVVPIGGKYYPNIGNQSYTPKNYTRDNNNPNLVFSMAFTGLLKCPAGSSASCCFFDSQAGANDTNGPKLHLPYSDGNIYMDLAGAFYRVQIPYANSGLGDTWCIFTAYYIVGLNNATSITAGMRNNGTDLTTGLSFTSTTTAATGAWDRGALFSDGAGANPWNGSVAEFMIYSPGALDDIYKAEGYLANKWGFASSLPAAHPYKATPPSNYPSDANVAGITTSINPSYSGFLNANSMPSPVAAYSMRWLDKNYRGACLRLRRDSDNAVVDIRFNSTTGLIDLSNTYAVGTTTSLGQTAAQFIGAGNGSVIVWYDQSGNNRHVGQVGSTAYPKLYRSGVLQMLNNKAAINWLTTENAVTASLDILIGTNGYSVVNRQQLGATKARTINSYSNNALYFTYSGNATSATVPIIYWNGNPNNLPTNAATTNICNYGVSHNSTALQNYFNGAVSGASFANPNTTAPGQFIFNGVGAATNEPSAVTHAEFIVFNKSLTTAQHLLWNNSVNIDL